MGRAIAVRRARRRSALAAAALTLLSCGPSATQQDRPDGLADRLAKVSEMRVFLGHQSVGQNILDGLADLSREAGAGEVAAQERRGGDVQAAGLLHARVGRNGDPRGKIDDFARILRDGMAAQVDWAGFKFCYVDFDAPLDEDALIEHYAATIKALAREHPQLRFFHCTVPLTVSESGAKAVLKRLLGRPLERERNERRCRVSAKIIRQFGGTDPVFDLAAVESGPDAADHRASQAVNAPCLSLWPAYTDDGGHLNAVGRRRAAAALLEFLARLPAGP